MTDHRYKKWELDPTNDRRFFMASSTQLEIQRQRGQIRMAEEHRRLLAEGYVWDGMDGYEKTEKSNG